ncbi:MAG: hypothetical protein ACI9WU_002865, partial [Myxococcota bacterium]
LSKLGVRFDRDLWRYAEAHPGHDPLQLPW